MGKRQESVDVVRSLLNRIFHSSPHFRGTEQLHVYSSGSFSGGAAGTGRDDMGSFATARPTTGIRVRGVRVPAPAAPLERRCVLELDVDR